MLNYKEYITEAQKLTHLEHIEDSIITLGPSGAAFALDMMTSVLKELSGNTDSNDTVLQIKADGCLHYDTILSTPNGFLELGELVEKGINTEVLTYNHKTNVPEYKKATNLKRNNNGKGWIELVLENDSTIKLTEDHEVYIKDVGYVKAKDLNENDEILSIKDRFETSTAIKKINRLKEKYYEYDITTINGNFFVKTKDCMSLVHNSPAVIAGIDPSNKRFFVATKSLFNKTPKINYNNEDIDNNHPAPGLNIKLKEALKYLPGVFPKEGIFQMDFMFSKKDLKTISINKEKYLTFTPNTITYGVPVNSELYNKIIKKDIGVALHTEYKGNSIADIKAEALFSTDRFKKNKNVMIFGNTIEEQHILFTQKEVQEIEQNINELKKDLKKFKEKDITVLKEFDISIKAFLNSLVKKGTTISTNSVKEFMDYLSNVEERTSSKYKTLKGKEKNAFKFKQMRAKIREYSGTLYYILLWNKNVSLIKERIIRKMNQLNTLNTFIKSGNNYVTTNPEGFVAIDRPTKSMVKLVSRLEFSRNNQLMSAFNK